ncbi:MAG: benzoate-CoA ligase family protein [Armatimonadota bacterium]|nr:benzoate-CoA ligase family protein [Armatimonadota bacterium]MDR7454258.1 benzoate-CoA ligase family protein [Armatimonadota bacterium]MDR7456792.1 benzoate-CoA ligase family protein [Armatimonadota bacterium]MDR7511734.1 benzoate-CoA ligase family protein [Armatimonadota bacterium]
MLTYADIPRRFNLTRYFLERNLEEGRGQRVALYAGGRAYTFAELSGLTNRIGHVLRELGVEHEDRVLLALADGVEFVASWFAVVKIGAVSAEVYTFLQPKDYAYYLNYTRARVVVVDATTREKVAAVRAECPFLRHVLVVGLSAGGSLSAAGPPPGPGEVDFDRLVAQAPEALEAADTSKDDVALWKFTTGSTGAPKAAVHAHHNPLINFHGYGLGVLGLTQDDIVLPVPKLFFGYARDLTALYNLGVGGAGVVFPERSTPERLFELIARHRPTILVQVPTMLNAMADHPDADRHDLRCLRLCTSAGEALPAEIYHKWRRRFGGEVLDGIGSSEVYHIYISNRPGRVRPGSVGELVPGYQAKVCDPDGRPLPTGEVGELWAGGESTALLYWDDHEKTKHTFHGDWVRTGDLFRQDADGFFWYQGRADDLLKVGGIWVAPLEIEGCLVEHEAVAECAVVGYEEAGLVLPRAYVVLRAGRAGGPELAKALQEFVRARLSPHKYPRDVRFIESMPRTPSGKVDRKALRAPDKRG